MSHKSFLLFSTALCAAISACPALAQTTPDAGEVQQDEIIVTGERVARGINETSSSVAVETADRIEERSVDNINSLLASVPNIQLGSEDQGPSIRGHCVIDLATLQLSAESPQGRSKGGE